ncbi:MAG: hypothetical protein BM485_03115 [Desulfobulbaceae bacterium DB1]|nr:MAG: hypothetical protein BM485_03115 [Desulfobulbaceae bacterium DB1]
MNGPRFPVWRPLRTWIDEPFGGHVPGQVAIRVDGARRPGLSFGHVARCVILAEAIRARGGESTFLMAEDEEGMLFVRQRGFTVLPLTGPANRLENTARLVDDLGARWIIVDLPYPELDIHALEAWNDSGARVIFIDDARFVFPRVTAVLNSSVRAAAAARLAPGNGVRLFLGPEHFILGNVPVARGPRAAGDPSILLTFGGSDPTRLTPRVVAALAAGNWGLARFTVVLGPGYGEAGELLRLTAGDERFDFVRAPACLLTEMLRHDLLVCAGGRTMQECLALGMPFLPVASTHSEAEEIAALAELGWVQRGLGIWNAEAFTATLAGFILDAYPCREHYPAEP